MVETSPEFKALDIILKSLSTKKRVRVNSLNSVVDKFIVNKEEFNDNLPISVKQHLKRKGSL